MPPVTPTTSPHPSQRVKAVPPPWPWPWPMPALPQRTLATSTPTAPALADAGIAPEDIGYINAHGTSTALNDSGETKAVKAVFGDHAHHLMMSSTKSMTGHLLGASGAVEAIFTAMALSHQFVPATIGYQTPDPDCDLDMVPNTGRTATFDYALSNNLGFGGHNAVVVLKRWEA